MIVKEKEMTWKDWLRHVAAEREFDKLHGRRQYKEVALKPEDWYTCPRCEGTGSYLMSGDAHRSEGIVPCGCHKGKVVSKTVEIKRRVRVKAGSHKW
jgi:hypothetical protein